MDPRVRRVGSGDSARKVLPARKILPALWQHSQEGYFHMYPTDSISLEAMACHGFHGSHGLQNSTEAMELDLVEN